MRHSSPILSGAPSETSRKEAPIDDVEKLIKTAMSEIKRLLSTKTVVGEPITNEGNTLIPLISVGFGFEADG